MAVVSKPLDPQKAKGYQLKDNVHTFHLIPSGTLCDHWSGHRDALKTGPILYKNFFLQRVDGFPYVEASMVLIAKRTNSDSQNLSAFQRNTNLEHMNLSFLKKDNFRASEFVLLAIRTNLEHLNLSNIQK